MNPLTSLRNFIGDLYAKGLNPDQVAEQLAKKARKSDKLLLELALLCAQKNRPYNRRSREELKADSEKRQRELEEKHSFKNLLPPRR
jgi:hypothetical protein